MKRLILAAFAPLALLACTTGPDGHPALPSPSEAAHSTIVDEKAITVAAKAVDAVALASSALVRTGVIEQGSPRAIQIANLLDRARDLVNAAATARTAHNYGEAMGALAPVLVDLASAIRG